LTNFFEEIQRIDCGLLLPHFYSLMKRKKRNLVVVMVVASLTRFIFFISLCGCVWVLQYLCSARRQQTKVKWDL
jgi:hypothetical protein